MAAFETHRPVAASAAGIFTTSLVRTLGAFQSWNDQRKTRKVLSKLTARELDDVGLTAAAARDVAMIIR